ncbi:NAP1-related protein 2-like [Phoenix dactylifera]|uniref:NAP1-related protein 2-like n=1 Tax=Phoenix dactylifera TaxID=42345 RepID=A0A8B8ZEF8_PHODC|nr:NAP1-related protein 2-like [Phoenix dactylifera]
MARPLTDMWPCSQVNEEASDKVLEVEQKYNEIRRPVYIKRNEIIQSIPDFWLTAFLSHPALSDLLTEEDQKIFKYLVSLDVEDCQDLKSGYSIIFNFSPNPYFEDTKLVKTYSFTEEGVANITGTTIKWKEGMEIANGNGHEKKGSKRPFTEERFLILHLLVEMVTPLIPEAFILEFYMHFFMLFEVHCKCKLTV